MNDDNNLYKSLYEDDESLDDDLGLNLLYDIYNHLDYEEMSKYYSIDQYNNTLPSVPDRIFSVLHMNTRSILKKINDLEVFFASLNKIPDVLAISESWLLEHNQHSAVIDGFKGYHLTRQSGLEHGGVSCFIREHLESELLDQFSFINDIIELCTVKVKVKDEHYIISTIYRPATKHDDVDLFIQLLVTY